MLLPLMLAASIPAVVLRAGASNAIKSCKTRVRLRRTPNGRHHRPLQSEAPRRLPSGTARRSRANVLGAHEMWRVWEGVDERRASGCYGLLGFDPV